MRYSKPPLAYELPHYMALLMYCDVSLPHNPKIYRHRCWRPRYHDTVVLCTHTVVLSVVLCAYTVVLCAYTVVLCAYTVVLCAYTVVLCAHPTRKTYTHSS